MMLIWLQVSTGSDVGLVRGLPKENMTNLYDILCRTRCQKGVTAVNCEESESALDVTAVILGGMRGLSLGSLG